MFILWEIQEKKARFIEISMYNYVKYRWVEKWSPLPKFVYPARTDNYEIYLRYISIFFVDYFISGRIVIGAITRDDKLSCNVYQLLYKCKEQ